MAPCVFGPLGAMSPHMRLYKVPEVHFLSSLKRMRAATRFHGRLNSVASPSLFRYMVSILIIGLGKPYLNITIKNGGMRGVERSRKPPNDFRSGLLHTAIIVIVVIFKSIYSPFMVNCETFK